eukprot:TRINITY_DN8246_c0_g1_i1.p1 TRINITY_DN8246_c0_g1~~TRINITY_DN8246_c0_g1_i1.p1  ORF type:complete len:308 (+),score=127.81 TRINITY_DN8246_c0_g1_i1:374-1297(+)
MGISSSSEDKKTPNASNGSKPTVSNSVGIRQGREKGEMDNTLFMGTPLETPLPLTSPVKIQISNSNYGERADNEFSSEEDGEKKALPTVFSWKHGGKSIYLSGSFNKWKERIPMQESHGDFTVIQTLPPGVYYYRFIVDGKWQTDPGLPMVTDANGEVNNIIEIKNQKQDSSSLLHGGNVNNTPPGSYGQEEKLPLPPPKPTSKGGSNSQTPSNNSPPSLPPHLLRALLNTSPPSKLDPSLLPLPHHVMLNHFYSLPRPEDDIVILGVTQRYKTKFVTTVFYKPLPPAVDDEFPSDGLSHVSFLSGE